MNTSDQRRLVRRKHRQQRRALTGPQRHAAERQITRAIVNHPWFIRARHVAFYWAFDGEANITAAASAAQRYNKRCYLPRIDGVGRPEMRFVTTDVGYERLGKNRYGIEEPADGLAIDPRQLDLVLMPLVAFDSNGTRLGMGGGYYDRSLAFLKTRRYWRHPKLLGVGFDQQRVDCLPRAAWDVPLHGAVTEAVTLSFSTAGER